MLKETGVAIIQSIERAMFLLELLAEGGGFSLADLSRRAGLKAPTCRNMLSTLITLGYASQDLSNRRYFITSKAIFGREQSIENNLIQQSLPVLQGLVLRCSETMILCRYRAGHRKTLLALESQQALRVSAQEGEDDRFFSTATGRMLLSHLPESEVRRLMKNQLDWAKQWPELAQSQSSSEFFLRIRQAGHLVFNRDKTIQALSVPIHFSGEALFATIGMYYPSVRHSPAEIPKLLGELKQAASKISDMPVS